MEDVITITTIDNELISWLIMQQPTDQLEPIAYGNDPIEDYSDYIY